MGKKEFTTSKSKMTVMMFSLEGDDATLQAGIRSISQAMSGFGKPVRLLSKSPTDIPAQPNENEVEEREEESEAVEMDEAIVNNQRASKPRSFKTPKIITLDLSSGTKPLKAFIESKNPGSTDTKRYLVIAVWLKETLSITNLTIDHFHTCYRHMGWQTPRDATKPLSNMSSKSKGWFEKGTGEGAFVITHVGENEVMQMGNSES